MATLLRATPAAAQCIFLGFTKDGSYLGAFPSNHLLILPVACLFVHSAALFTSCSLMSCRDSFVLIRCTAVVSAAAVALSSRQSAGTSVGEAAVRRSQLAGAADAATGFRGCVAAVPHLPRLCLAQ
jgi:hypothetical protein